MSITHDEIIKMALSYYEKAGITLTQQEKDNIEITDFGLGNPLETGLQVVTYINTERVCAKELSLFPWQICPEHRHPLFENYPGKEETFRCRYGTVYVYVAGEPTPNPTGVVPMHDKAYYTAWHEIILRPGEQYTLAPNTSHWFQAGEEGAVVSEFSSPSYDEKDIFLNPNIKRSARVL